MQFKILKCLQNGDTPLHVACRKKFVNIVELLLGKFSANISIRNQVLLNYVSCQELVVQF